MVKTTIIIDNAARHGINCTIWSKLCEKHNIPGDYSNWCDKTKRWLEQEENEVLGRFFVELQDKAVKTSKINSDILREQIMTDLLTHNRDRATEKMVEYVKSKYRIYTTMNDNNPEMWCYHEGIYTRNGKSKIKELCRSIVGDIYTTHLINNVIEKIQADSYIDEYIFYNTILTDEIIVQNGILNIKTNELTKFTPDKIFFNKLPMRYEPKATCPNFLKHLEEVLKHEEDITVIQELFGWCLYKSYSIEKAFMFIGNGRNGKGKTLSVLEKVIGSENCSHITLHALETDPYAIGELYNKMANIGGDLDRTSLKKSAKFKTLTGQDTINAQRKYLTDLKFYNFAKMIFATNELPITYDTGMGFFSRWILVEFPYTFVSKDAYEKIPDNDKSNYRINDINIIDKLTTKEELEGILVWALKGLERLLGQENFSNSKNTEEIKKLWILKSDSFSMFFEDYLIEDFNAKTPKNYLRIMYNQYCKSMKTRQISEKIIKYKLAEKGIYDIRIQEQEKRILYWEGIKLRDGVDHTMLGLDSDCHTLPGDKQQQEDILPFPAISAMGNLPLREFTNSLDGKTPMAIKPTEPDNKKDNIRIFEEIYDYLCSVDSEEIGFNIEDLIKRLIEKGLTSKDAEDLIKYLKSENLYFEKVHGYLMRL